MNLGNTSTLAGAGVSRSAGIGDGTHHFAGRRPRIFRPAPGPARRRARRRTPAIVAAIVAFLILLTVACIYFWPVGREAIGATKAAVAHLTDPELVPDSAFVAYPPLPELTEVVTRVATQDPVVFITIDDGWTLDPRVLDLLRARGAPITAFPVGKVVESHIETWRAYAALGGTIENHSYSHPFLGRIPPDQQVQEVCGPADLIQRTTGRRPTMLRPPYGSYDDATKTVTPSCGHYALVKWSVEVRNGEMSFAGPGRQLVPGDIVLLHFRPETYDELVSLFAQMDSLGLHAAPLQDYLGPFARTDAQRAAAAARGTP
ncbi:MAG: polysaccharide deacetylase family protein [Acidimicrobiia bacterium]|nr:polysaccharide deacetylase family protein [Acidimicrobiia bacterium]